MKEEFLLKNVVARVGENSISAVIQITALDERDLGSLRFSLQKETPKLDSSSCFCLSVHPFSCTGHAALLSSALGGRYTDF